LGSSSDSYSFRSTWLLCKILSFAKTSWRVHQQSALQSGRIWFWLSVSQRTSITRVLGVVFCVFLLVNSVLTLLSGRRLSDDHRSNIVSCPSLLTKSSKANWRSVEDDSMAIKRVMIRSTWKQDYGRQLLLQRCNRLYSKLQFAGRSQLESGFRKKVKIWLSRNCLMLLLHSNYTGLGVGSRFRAL
jgi:hypothetical protein